MESWEQEEARSKARSRMLIGAFLFIGGLALTIAGASSAASNSGGGRFLVFIGAIVGGFITFLKGLMDWSETSSPGDKDVKERPLPPHVQNQIDLVKKRRP